MLRKNGVRVVIRIRPTATFASQQIQLNLKENTIAINAAPELDAANHTEYESSDKEFSKKPNTSTGPYNRKESWKFKYHQILYNVDQDQVYAAIAREIVHGALMENVNGTILAYGQTGAGKSYTMIGDTRNYQYRGIAPRAIAQIFDHAENYLEYDYRIHVSYMEIYNDRIYDLLSRNENSRNSDESNAEFTIIEDARGTFVRGLKQIQVRSEQEALDQLFYGELQRTVAEHQLNKRSNRSHCIFTMYISQRSKIMEKENLTYTKLHLVDLAGSERIKKTMTEGDRDNFRRDDRKKKAFSMQQMATIKRESMYINQSLSFLEQCIVSLGSREARHIPYRQTKLTNVLKDSIGGNANTLMFACVWGESRHLEETTSTLRLAQRMMHVHNEVTAVVEINSRSLLRRYEKQIEQLKHELIMHNALADRSGILYDEPTSEQKADLRLMVERFLDATTQEIEDESLRLSSVQEIRELFRQFKYLYRKLDSASSATASSNSLRDIMHGSDANVADTKGSNSSDLSNSFNEAVVGEVYPNLHGFGLGLASADARPIKLDVMVKLRLNDKKDESEAYKDCGSGRSNAKSPTKHYSQAAQAPASVARRMHKMNSIDCQEKNEAYKQYTDTAGKEVFQSLRQEKDKLRQLKQIIRNLVHQVETTKKSTDEFARRLENKRYPRDDIKAPEAVSTGTTDESWEAERETIDEEEYTFITSMREGKRKHKMFIDQLREVKMEKDLAKRNVQLFRMRLVREFEDWFANGNCVTINPSLGLRNTKSNRGDDLEEMERRRIQVRDQDSDAFFRSQRRIMQDTTKALQARQQRRIKRGI